MKALPTKTSNHASSTSCGSHPQFLQDGLHSARAGKGVATDFWVGGGRIDGRVANLPQNTLKIGKSTGFWPLHSRIWGGRTTRFSKVRGSGPPPPRPPRRRRPCVPVFNHSTAFSLNTVRSCFWPAYSLWIHTAPHFVAGAGHSWILLRPPPSPPIPLSQSLPRRTAYRPATLADLNWPAGCAARPLDAARA